MISSRTTLATFFALGGALLLLVVATPTWQAVDRPQLTLFGVLALAVAGALLRLRRLPRALTHILLLLGTVLVALAVHAGRGGAPSALIAMFSCWIAIHGALFLPRGQAALHVAAALTGAAGALLLVEPGPTAALEAVLVWAVTSSSGLVVGSLTRRNGLLSTTDALTGTLNEAGLAEVVHHDLAGVDEGSPGLLVLFDIDRFGELNQALGRDSGDELLRQVARAHRRALAGHGTVARLGGDDFAVWLPRVPDALRHPVHGLDPERMARMVAEQAGGPFELAGVAVDVDLTFGAVLAPVHGRDLTTLLQRADTALHAARRADRQAQLWSPELDEHTADGVELQAQLRTAVTEGQLRLHYQPLVDAHGLGVRGVEALVRWQHPTRGLLAPGAFLPEAERTPVIVALTDWVLGEALRQAAAWLRRGRPLRVSVNLSARLVAHEGLVAQVRDHLAASGVPPHLLVLEVTESAVTAQPRRAAATLAELRALGVGLALDDFGTGYTSLAMLRDLPFGELKVDQRFVRGALRGGGDEAIVRSVLELGHRLGLEVVAEGVEDDATRRLLAELGYDLLQGYHFSRPVPAAEVEALSFASAAPDVAVLLVPEVEAGRARAAEEAAALTGPDDPVLRELAAIAARVLDVPTAMVSLVGGAEQLVGAAVGTAPAAVPVEWSFCRHALTVDGVLQVPDAGVDPRFRDLPSVVGASGVRFYAGAPVRDAAGRALGAVCVLDDRPRTLTAAQEEVLRGLARAAGARLVSLVGAAA
ncbi:EAL domain-containing protein [Kineococcus glutinatus]|uniref:Diguanylate cyclase (GGDEF)-like protein n=1 Tax=Kineococcus glutinatus TaxID=1070872 RepID=A0ABP9HPT3_9ACTN